MAKKQTAKDFGTEVFERLYSYDQFQRFESKIVNLRNGKRLAILDKQGKVLMTDVFFLEDDGGDYAKFEIAYPKSVYLHGLFRNQSKDVNVTAPSIDTLKNLISEYYKDIFEITESDSKYSIVEKKQTFQESLNQILFGPPGTGKTYNTINMALDILGVPPMDKEGNVLEGKWYANEKADRETACNLFNGIKQEKGDGEKGVGRIAFTTFHQSMSYEDFIEGIKPELGEGSEKVGYKIEPGIFKQIADEARQHPNEPYVLIIDEINRGNVANIFGELITLIEPDKREGEPEALEVVLPYSKKPFSVPKNLYIIGTMNTADRSVEALDTALRRRFSFVEMMPKPELLSEVDGVNLKNLLTTINRRIEVLKDRDHLIGHSYFMKVKSKEQLIDIIYRNVIPLLQEYFYGDYGKIRMVLGDGFVTKDNDLSSVVFATSGDDFDRPENCYQITDIRKVKVDIDKAIELMKFGYVTHLAEVQE